MYHQLRLMNKPTSGATVSGSIDWIPFMERSKRRVGDTTCSSIHKVFSSKIEIRRDRIYMYKTKCFLVICGRGNNDWDWSGLDLFTMHRGFNDVSVCVCGCKGSEKVKRERD